MGLTDLIAERASEKVLEKVMPTVEQKIKSALSENNISEIRGKVEEYFKSDEYEGKIQEIIGKEMEKHFSEYPVLIFADEKEFSDYKSKNELVGPISTFLFRVDDVSNKSRALYDRQTNIKEETKSHGGNIAEVLVEDVNGDGDTFYLHGKIYRNKKFMQLSENSETMKNQ